MKADRNQLKQHIDIVIVNAKVLIIGIWNQVKSQCIKYFTNIQKFLKTIHVDSHEDDVEVCHCLK